MAITLMITVPTNKMTLITSHDHKAKSPILNTLQSLKTKKTISTKIDKQVVAPKIALNFNPISKGFVLVETIELLAKLIIADKG